MIFNLHTTDEGELYLFLIFYKGVICNLYYVDFSLTNGLSKPSISIYYSGCDIPTKCKDCHNPELWKKQKEALTYEEIYKKVKWYKDFQKEKLRVSFLGGEPLASYNVDSVIEISKRLKEDFSNIELILYSWRKPELIEEEWVKYFDYGVLGEFKMDSLQEGFLPASKNQIIYDFKNKEALPPIKLKGDKK